MQHYYDLRERFQKSTEVENIEIGEIKTIMQEMRVVFLAVIMPLNAPEMAMLCVNYCKKLKLSFVDSKDDKPRVISAEQLAEIVIVGVDKEVTNDMLLDAYRSICDYYLKLDFEKLIESKDDITTNRSFAGLYLSIFFYVFDTFYS